jgi:hypothetical protein
MKSNLMKAYETAYETIRDGNGAQNIRGGRFSRRIQRVHLAMHKRQKKLGRASQQDGTQGDRPFICIHSRRIHPLPKGNLRALELGECLVCICHQQR